MSSTYFNKFQEILRGSKQSPSESPPSERQRDQQRVVSEDFSDTSRSKAPSVISTDPPNDNNDEPRILRLTARWSRPHGDLSCTDLVLCVEWEMLSQPWTIWKPLDTDSRTLLPALTDFPQYNLRLMNEISTSSTVSPDTSGPFSLRAPVPYGSVREHIIHERIWTPSGSNKTERLRIGRHSPISCFFWSKNLGLGLLEEGRDPSFVDIPERHFPALFFMIEEIHRHMVDLEESTNEFEKRYIVAFKAFFALINDLFSDARVEQSRMQQSRLVSFDFLWTLFPRDQLLYEKRPLSFYDESFEQCLKLVSIEKARSSLDGMFVWHLTLKEVVCRPGIGPCLVTTHRYIRFFSGMKPITDECIGILPLEMIPQGERMTLIIRLSDIGRRYIEICSQPWTIWEYEGPVLFPHLNLSDHSGKQSYISPDNKAWQRYTRERIIVDATISQDAYKVKVDGHGWVDEFLGHKKSLEEVLTLKTCCKDMRSRGLRRGIYITPALMIPATLLFL